MATNDPNKPDNVTFIDPGNKTPIKENTAPDQPAPEGSEAPAPEMTAEEQLEPPAPFDIGGGHIPDMGEAGAAEPDKETALPAPDKKADAPEKPEGRGRPPKAPEAEKPTGDKPKPRAPKEKAAVGADKSDKKDKKTTPAKKEKTAPPAPEKPAEPREAPRSGEPEQIVYLNISELYAFKDHPFGVRDDKEMQSLVESVKDKGVNQPALVRPRPEGGYEIIAGHRRQKASELAGFADMPCIVRNMTDDEAILAMTDDNLRQGSEILPSERAVSLKMQVEAISHQGARTSGQNDQKEAGQRSVDIVAERNGISAKQVQRYMRLTELVPDLRKLTDEKRLSLTAAVEFSFIQPKNQRLMAVSLDGEQNSPSLSQAQKLRGLDKEGKLNGDVIDGILCEQKKEVEKVIISGEELNKYFGKDKTPREMKEQIIKLLDDWSGKQKDIAKPEKKPDLEK